MSQELSKFDSMAQGNGPGRRVFLNNQAFSRKRGLRTHHPGTTGGVSIPTSIAEGREKNMTRSSFDIFPLPMGRLRNWKITFPWLRACVT